MSVSVLLTLVSLDSIEFGSRTLTKTNGEGWGALLYLLPPAALKSYDFE